MNLKIDRNIKIGIRDFNARIDGDDLLIPAELSGFGTTVEELVSYLQSCPAAVAHLLWWPIDDVVEARSKLLKLLDGKLPQEVLKPKKIETGFGAVSPEILIRRLADKAGDQIWCLNHTAELLPTQISDIIFEVFKRCIRTH